MWQYSGVVGGLRMIESVSGAAPKREFTEWPNQKSGSFSETRHRYYQSYPYKQRNFH
jgi:hypothetical protein